MYIEYNQCLYSGKGLFVLGGQLPWILAAVLSLIPPPPHGSHRFPHVAPMMQTGQHTYYSGCYCQSPGTSELSTFLPF